MNKHQWGKNYFKWLKLYFGKLIQWVLEFLISSYLLAWEGEEFLTYTATSQWGGWTRDDLPSFTSGLAQLTLLLSNASSCRNSQMFEEEELPVSPKPDLKHTPPPPSPPVGDERAQTPPPDKPVAAAPSQLGEAGRSFNKVWQLWVHCSDLQTEIGIMTSSLWRII